MVIIDNGNPVFLVADHWPALKFDERPAPARRRYGWQTINSKIDSPISSHRELYVCFSRNSFSRLNKREWSFHRRPSRNWKPAFTQNMTVCNVSNEDERGHAKVIANKFNRILKMYARATPPLNKIVKRNHHISTQCCAQIFITKPRIRRVT